jgi:hypothetical protein
VLGDIILQHTGKVSDIRIVDSERKKKENSVRATGLANRIGEAYRRYELLEYTV